MFPLFLFFISLPLIEIWVMIQVGQIMGALNTLTWLALMALLGMWMIKREGKKTFVDLQMTLNQGQMPAGEMMRGFLAILGGILLIAPGFVSDLFGIVLIVPFTRNFALRVMKHFLAKRIRFQTMAFTDGRFRSSDSETMRDVGPSAGKFPGSGNLPPRELL